MKTVIYLGIFCLYCGYTEEAVWNPSVHECPEWEDECHPSVVEVASFNLTADVDSLYNAQKNKDYKELINIIVRRSTEQRESISQAYRQQWGLDLNKIFKKKMGRRNLRKLIEALMKPLQTFYKDELEIAMHNSINTHFNILDILGTLSNQGISAVDHIYHDDTKRFLAQVISVAAHMKGKTLDLFQSLARRNKIEGISVNSTAVEEDVLELQRSEEQNECDFQVFSNFILKHNNVHLRTVYDRFFQLNEYTFGDSLANSRCPKNETFLRSSLIELYKITNNRTLYFAERLHSSLNRYFPDHDTIRRIMVGRAEIDLENIKAVYYDTYHHTLTDMIKDKISKLYKFALLKLLEDTSSRGTSEEQSVEPESSKADGDSFLNNVNDEIIDASVNTETINEVVIAHMEYTPVEGNLPPSGTDEAPVVANDCPVPSEADEAPIVANDCLTPSGADEAPIVANDCPTPPEADEALIVTGDSPTPPEADEALIVTGDSPTPPEADEALIVTGDSPTHNVRSISYHTPNKDCDDIDSKDPESNKENLNDRKLAEVAQSKSNEKDSDKEKFNTESGDTESSDSDTSESSYYINERTTYFPFVHSKSHPYT